MKTLENNSGNRRARRAFSLIELLIVMALIVIMYFMYLSGGSKSYQLKRMKLCQKNLQTDFVALKIYSQDYDGAFPVVPGALTSETPLSLLFPKYTTSTEYFICPGTKDEVPPPAKPLTNSRISYAYYMGARITDGAVQPLMSDAQIDTSAKKRDQPAFSSDGEGEGNNHDQYGGVVLFCDGSLKTSGTNATMALPLNRNIVLLNPKKR